MPEDPTSYWMREIRAAKKREKDFRKFGKHVVATYSAERDASNVLSDSSEIAPSIPFNILFSNTETLLPAIYSRPPRPIVNTRFKNASPVMRAAAKAAKSMLEYLIDTNQEGYETVHDALLSATLDGLLPGRGITQVMYDADIHEDQVLHEIIVPTSRPWDHVIFGDAKRWEDVPWIAFQESITKQEATERFGRKIADELHYGGDDPNDYGDDEANYEDEDADNGSMRRYATIYQIWDKEHDRKVLYVHEYYKKGYLAEPQDDPLGLTGFYPIPKPLQFVLKSHDLKPVSLYKLYERQAEELNILTERILKISNAIKVRGVYNGAYSEEMQNLMNASDDTLVPTDQAAALATEGGLDKNIWFMPLGELSAVHERLIQAREQVKRVIFEITGISDIVRGSTRASETLGAQQLKSQWGTMRLRRLQAEAQRYSRDVLRLMLELAATKLSEQTWAQATGLPFVKESEWQSLQMAVQQARALGQPIPQDLQQRLSVPRWEDILQLLRNDLSRAYVIDVETNSTIAPEAAEDQQNIIQLMVALGQYLNGVAPLIERGALPFGAAKSMLLTIAKRFQFGREIEEEIQSMQPPSQDDKMKELQANLQAMEQKMKDQMEKQQLLLKVKEMEAANRLRDERAQLDVKKYELYFKNADALKARDIASLDASAKRAGLQYKAAELDMIKQQMQKNLSLTNDRGFKQHSKILTKSIQSLQQQQNQTVEVLSSMQQELTAQQLAMKQLFENMMTVMRTPKVKKVIRGKDGKIESVQEVMQALEGTA